MPPRPIPRRPMRDATALIDSRNPWPEFLAQCRANVGAARSEAIKQEERWRELLKEVFIWACERSAARYGAVRQSLGDPDPFRLRYRAELREVAGACSPTRIPRRRPISRSSPTPPAGIPRWDICPRCRREQVVCSAGRSRTPACPKRCRCCCGGRHDNEHHHDAAGGAS